MKSCRQDNQWSIRRQLFSGWITVMVLTLGLGSWVCFAELSGAILVKGHLNEGSGSVPVQHATGGTVSSVLVSDGDFVDEGAALLRLGDADIRSELTQVQLRLDEIMARADRLRAERDGTNTIETQTLLLARTQVDGAVTKIIRGQQQLHASRTLSWEQEEAVLRQHALQLRTKIRGLKVQIDAVAQQRRILVKQFSDKEALFEKGLLSSSALSTLQNAIILLRGKSAAFDTEIAETYSEISAIELEVLRAISKRREDAIVQLRDLDLRQRELQIQKEQLHQRLAQRTLYAPITGLVYGIGTLDEKSVLEPAATAMRIVPKENRFTISTQISPADIDEIFQDQAVHLNYTTVANLPDTEFSGVVTWISPDVFQDHTTGEWRYHVDVTPDPHGTSLLLDRRPNLAGFPVEVVFATQKQRVWRYLSKPFASYFSRALRES